MRRGLSLGDLGDLFDLPLAAVISLGRPDGTVFSRPVWHRWEDGRFMIQIPAGDRKILMLERDDRLTVVLSENEFPYRGIEVRGRARLRHDRYHERGLEICRRYVEAYDSEADVDAYLSIEPGVIVEVQADTTNCWDYADDDLMPA